VKLHGNARQRIGARVADIPGKLEQIVADIKESGHANLTRLTVLKKWFETSHHIPSFGIFIAKQASRQRRKTSKEAPELFREVDEILAGVDVFAPRFRGMR
jgi:hypothetical protein